MVDVAAVRSYVLEAHRGTLEAVLECADAVAADADSADGRVRARRLERELDDAGVLAAFPDLLAGAAAAAGDELPATPVAAPPYVAVTSLGPVARATLADGRLVVAVEVFAVERGDSPRYVRRGESPADALVVEFR